MSKRRERKQLRRAIGRIANKSRPLVISNVETLNLSEQEKNNSNGFRWFVRANIISAFVASIWALSTIVFPAFVHSAKLWLSPEAWYYFGDFRVIKRRSLPGETYYAIDVSQGQFYHARWADYSIISYHENAAQRNEDIADKIRSAIFEDVVVLDGYSYHVGRKYFEDDDTTGPIKDIKERQPSVLFNRKTVLVIKKGECLKINAVTFEGPRRPGATFNNNVFVKGKKSDCP